MNTKTCPLCNVELPISSFSKHRKKSNNGKYYMFTRGYCKPCRSIDEYKRQIKNNPYTVLRDNSKYRAKVCVECHRTYLGNGRTMYCSNTCISHKRLKFSPRKTPEHTMGDILCRICGDVFVGKTNRVYCSDECKAEYSRIKQREYRLAHSELAKGSRERLEEWKTNNPDRVKETNSIARAKRRHEQSGVNNPSALTAEQWRTTLKVFDNCCAYCGVSLEDGHHKDHFIPMCMDGEFTKSNMVPSCPSCNQLKGGLHPRDFCEEDTYNTILEKIV